MKKNPRVKRVCKLGTCANKFSTQQNNPRRACYKCSPKPGRESELQGWVTYLGKVVSGNISDEMKLAMQKVRV